MKFKTLEKASASGNISKNLTKITEHLKKNDKEKKKDVDLGDLAEEFAKKRLEKELEK
jgi:hypothetical protein